MTRACVRRRPAWCHRWLPACLALIALVAATIGPTILWFLRESANIRHLEEEAKKLGGSVTTPPGGFSLWHRSIELDLRLRRSSVDDAALARLVGMPAFIDVRSLDLSDTRITDEGVKALRNVTRISGLDLSRTRITDKSLRHLATMKGLGTLRLSGTKVSDAGLEILRERGSPISRSLFVTDTEVTEDGVRKLFAKFDRWNIFYGSSRSPENIKKR